MKKSKNLYFFSLFCIVFHQQVQAKLKFIVQLYSNGATGPLAGDQIDLNNFAVNYKELNSIGQIQHYNLGLQMKMEYKDFLSEIYNKTQIFVRSTDTNRTLMSAAAHLQGMYPNGTGDNLPKKFNIEHTYPAFKNSSTLFKNSNSALPNKLPLIPIHSQSIKQDLLLRPYSNCETFAKFVKKFILEKKEEVEFIDQQFWQTYQSYSQAIGRKIKNFYDIEKLEQLFTNNKYNESFMKKFNKELQNNITFLTSLSQSLQSQQSDLLRALNTPFLNQVISYLQPVVDGTDKIGLKWVMYSAHTQNVQLLSQALNFTSVDCLLSQRFDKFKNENKTYFNCEQYPEFTSNIIIELHESEEYTEEEKPEIKKEKFYIKARRDGKFMNLCEQEKIYCSYEEFKERIMYFVTDFEKVCKLHNTKLHSKIELKKPEDAPSSFEDIFKGTFKYITFMVVEGLIILFGALYICLIKKRNKNNKYDSQSSK